MKRIIGVVAVVLLFGLAVWLGYSKLKPPSAQVREVVNQKNESKKVASDTDKNEIDLTNEKYRSTYKGDDWFNREVNYDLKATKLSKKLLCSTIWCFGDYYMLVFFSDDVFYIGTSQADVEIEGKYRIVNDSQVELLTNHTNKIVDIINRNKNEIAFREKEILTFRYNLDEILYSAGLFAKDDKLFCVAGGSSQEGKIVKKFNEEIMIENQAAVALERLKFYTEPDRSSKTISISFPSLDDKEIDYLMIGTEFTVCGKIINSKTKNNWYYVSIFYESGECFLYGWINTEQLEIFDPKKKAEYERLYEAEKKRIKAEVDNSGV